MKGKHARRQCFWYPVCPMKRFYESGLLDGDWVRRYCMGDNQSCVRFQMETRGQPHPDNMLPDGSLDESLGQ